jgi:peptidoglycan/LPS O-acetylase OafA/YrhL
MPAGGGGMKGGADFNRNNLDCLRLILASTVALYHISALTDLPAFALLGRYCSPHFAVRAFFVISGLLIYRSYIRSSTVRSYFEKRIRRIYPAYVTTIVITAIALCLLSTVPLSQYFGSGFWKYLGANLLFLNFLAPSLPGVFTGHSMPAVNGALWTLKIEVGFYLFVPFIHYLCNKFGTKTTVGAIFILSSIWKYGFTWLAATHNTHALFSLDASRNLYSQLSVQFPAQMAYFSAGILLLLYFDRLQNFFPAILGLTACLFLVDHFFTGELLDVFWISGFVFCFGFWRFLGNFSKYGDFSYGVYIVHWPIIQILIALGLTRLNASTFFVCCILAIALISVSMWHFIESKCLASSNHYRRAAIEAPAS